MLAPRKTLWSTPSSVSSLASSLLSPLSTDTIYDVGCGDARVLIHLAQTSPCLNLTGIEIDESRANQARDNVKKAKLNHRITILNENALYVDYSSCSIIFLYLVPRGLRLIKPLILSVPSYLKYYPSVLLKRKKLKVVTYMSGFVGEVPVREERVEAQKGRGWPVFYYEFYKVVGVDWLRVGGVVLFGVWLSRREKLN